MSRGFPARTAVLGSLGGIVVAVVLFAASASASVGSFLSYSAVGLASASGAAAITGLAGFLFGIPRRTESDDAVARRYEPSTSLEQVSDWLTKLIIGATFVQVGEILAGLGAVVDVVAGGMGGGDSAVPFSAGLLLFSGTLGFVVAWVVTRLRLMGALSEADRLVQAADRAEDQGDIETAERLREAAALLSPADEYELLRSRVPSGPARTRGLEGVYERAMVGAARTGSSRDEVVRDFEAGSDGRRIEGLAKMAGSIESAADTELIVTAIMESRSAFEQYQALRLAVRLTCDGAAGITSQERTMLRAAAQKVVDGDVQYPVGSDRRALAEQVLRCTSGPEN